MIKQIVFLTITLFLIVSCDRENHQPETEKIFTVNVSEGTGAGTLHAAIRNANMETMPCKIIFNKVTAITLKEELPEISCLVSIDGGKDGVTIDAGGKQRIFTIAMQNADLIPEVSLANLTLTGGYSGEDGGAIYVNSIYGVFSFNNCVFKNNKAKDSGGAIFSKSQISIYHCMFSGNESRWGGAIRVFYSQHLQVEHSLFEKNKAFSGGAIIVDSSTSIYISDCIFSNNEAENIDEYGNSGRGGAIVTANMLHIFNSLFVKNRTNGNGGAIDLNLSSHFVCMNSTFVENSADGRGGAICTSMSRLESNPGLSFSNCTFFGNMSGSMGGAVFGHSCSFLNNIFTGNKVSDESTDYYHNILTGNRASPEATSDFFAEYLHMAYTIYDKFFVDEKRFVTGNVQATSFDVFGTDQPQLKDNILTVLSTGPANGLGRLPCLQLFHPEESFSYKDGGIWKKLYDGSEYTITEKDSIFTADQTGFLRPENNITAGAWQIR